MPLENEIVSNPWDNVYWFSRMLINSDKYGGIGSDIRAMNSVAIEIRLLLDSERLEDENEALQSIRDRIKEVLLHNRRKNSAIYKQIEAFCDDINQKVTSVKDYEILAFTCQRIMIPINEALKKIPSDDNSFVESVANAILREQGVHGLANLINILDAIGLKGCMAVERKQIIKSFGQLRAEISNWLDEEEVDVVLTAFCQEFERRVGQKRKDRAGRSVEGTTSLILNYFGIKTTDAPEHFTTGLEIDKWIKTKDRWIIGISCKRTLRERWKQAYTTDLGLLNRHKIRELWYVVAYDKDLSDEKITEIGSHKAVLYLPDDSPKLWRAQKHPGMKDYVRPMTHFVDDLRKLI